MSRSTSYKTKQREAILGYIASLKDAHVTAAQISQYFAKEALPVGKATIYRHLDKLTENGVLRRYVSDGISGACYQYVGNEKNKASHLHLKCNRCGELLHLKCEALSDLERHVSDIHSFQVDTMKTVLYGLCEGCKLTFEGRQNAR